MLRCKTCRKAISPARAVWRKSEGKSGAFCSERHAAEWLAGAAQWKLLENPDARHTATERDFECAEMERAAGCVRSVNELAGMNATAAAWLDDGCPIVSPSGAILRCGDAGWQRGYDVIRKRAEVMTAAAAERAVI